MAHAPQWQMPLTHLKAANMVEKLHHQMNADPRPLAEVARPNVPAALTDVVMEALSRAPQSRPPLAKIVSTLRDSVSSPV